jgi:hypothetical protein
MATMTNEEFGRYLRSLPAKKFRQWKMRGWGLHLVNRCNTRRNRRRVIERWWNRADTEIAKWKLKIVNRKSEMLEDASPN